MASLIFPDGKSPGYEWEAPNGKTYVLNSNNSWSILASAGASAAEDPIPDWDTAGWPATHPGLMNYGFQRRSGGSSGQFTYVIRQAFELESAKNAADIMMRQTTSWINNSNPATDLQDHQGIMESCSQQSVITFWLPKPMLPSHQLRIVHRKYNAGSAGLPVDAFSCYDNGALPAGGQTPTTKMSLISQSSTGGLVDEYFFQAPSGNGCGQIISAIYNVSGQPGYITLWEILP